jgi:vacuolar-type H+-ATPase subunit F/Vma7
MPAPAYLGDEISAAGYRLAGAEVIVPAEGNATAAFHAARASSPLVLVSAAVAAGIDPGELRSAMMALQPLVLIVPDVHGEVPLPDLAARLRGQLGMEA